MRKRWRFTSEFKAKVVLEVLTGAMPTVASKHTLSPNLLGLVGQVLERAHAVPARRAA